VPDVVAQYVDRYEVTDRGVCGIDVGDVESGSGYRQSLVAQFADGRVERRWVAAVEDHMGARGGESSSYLVAEAAHGAGY
jgi:hypothetical protein